MAGRGDITLESVKKYEIIYCTQSNYRYIFVNDCKILLFLEQFYIKHVYDSIIVYNVFI